MSYTIHYDKSLPENNKKTLPPWQKKLLVMMGVFVVLALIGNLWPQGRAFLQNIFLPGADSSTSAAFQTFLNEVENGEPFGKVVTAFCQEVIDEAR